MDVLADVLNTMHVESHVQFSMELTAPWGIKAKALKDAAPFFVVSRGSCYLEVEGVEAAISLVGGDLVMLPHGNAHTVRDQLESPALPLEGLTEACPTHNTHRVFRHGGGGSLTAMVAGCFVFEWQVSRPFLSALPPLIHLRGEQGQMVPWLDTTLKWMAAETNSKGPGAQIMASRLTDMLFIQILRAHIAENAGRERECEAKAGWLRAMADPNIGKAFELIHEKPDRPWTVAELASQVNMSRTAFSTRFTSLAGVPPLTYATKWRMLKAGDLLRRGEATIGDIAARVGYESEAAFSKAFKREMGVAPGAYRREGKDGRSGIRPAQSTV